MKYLLNNKSYLITSLIVLFIISSIIFGPKTEKYNIGIVEIEGTIIDSKNIVKTLHEFNKRDDIQAIIVRLNTPGGAVAPSQEIYEKVKTISLENKKPIIASIGSIAASGGYYIAIGADKIIANPGSITGSIGVIINFPIAKDLVDKIGLKFKTVKSGELKDAGSPYRNTTDDENIFFQKIVDDLHDQFTAEVSNQRNISKEEIQAYSDGRIFTGKEAYKLGLIDSLGTFEDALNISKNLANILEETNLIYPKKERGQILRMLFDESKLLFNALDRLPMYLFNN